MNNEENNAESWAPCAPGTLSTYARQAKTKRLKQTMTRAAGVTAVILCVLGVGIWGVNTLTTGREHYFGGIACSEVRSQMQAYSMGSLPTELRNRIADHLKQCPDCQQLMRQMGASVGTGQDSGCSCAACRQLAQLESSHRSRWQAQPPRDQFVLVADAR